MGKTHVDHRIVIRDADGQILRDELARDFVAGLALFLARAADLQPGQSVTLQHGARIVRQERRGQAEVPAAKRSRVPGPYLLVQCACGHGGTLHEDLDGPQWIFAAMPEAFVCSACGRRGRPEVWSREWEQPVPGARW